MKSMWSRHQPASEQGIAPSQVLELIDEALTKLASEEGAVSRRDAIDAFLELRLAVAATDAVERFLAGDRRLSVEAVEDATPVRA
jgi:hypothetical protein